MSSGTKYGLLSGLVANILLFILHAIEPTLIFEFWFFSILIPGILVFFLIMAAGETRIRSGGYASFRQLLRPTFSVVIFTQMLLYLGNYVLYNYANTDLPRIQKQYELEALEKKHTQNLINSTTYREQKKQIEEADYQLVLSKAVINYFFSLIMGFIFAMIVAFIMKKRLPAPSS